VFTVNELVNDNKVSFHTFFIHFAKIRLADGYETVTKLKNQSRIGIIPERL
jgi:hypothetical protein